MNQRFWGVPYLVWSGLCLIPTIIWVFVWPQAQAATLTGLPFLLLRWGHALTWALLSIAAFLAAFRVGGNTNVARLAAYASLGVYLAFLFTFITHS